MGVAWHRYGRVATSEVGLGSGFCQQYGSVIRWMVSATTGPRHMLYSALRCMACQEWQQQHVCPICRKSDHNTGGVHVHGHTLMGVELT